MPRKYLQPRGLEPLDQPRTIQAPRWSSGGLRGSEALAANPISVRASHFSHFPSSVSSVARHFAIVGGAVFP
jgi:hypothetical protein